MVIQIVIILFTLFVISRAFLRYKEKNISLIEFILWALLWIGIIIAALLPQTTTFLAKILGVGRGVDAVLYLAIIVLFYGLFRLYIKQEHIEHEITKIVRHIALKEKDEKEKER